MRPWYYCIASLVSAVAAVVAGDAARFCVRRRVRAFFAGAGSPIFFSSGSVQPRCSARLNAVSSASSAAFSCSASSVSSSHRRRSARSCASAFCCRAVTSSVTAFSRSSCTRLARSRASSTDGIAFMQSTIEPQRWNTLGRPERPMFTDANARCFTITCGASYRFSCANPA